MANLRDEILKLTNPAPVFKDPEDNSEDETSAKLVDQVVEGFDEVTQPSQLRQKTAIILADTDRRYAGKKTSRKNLNYESSDNGEESGDSDDEVDSDDEYKIKADEGDDNGLNDDDSDDGSEDMNGLEEESDDDVKTMHLDRDVDGEADFNEKFSQFGTKEFIFKDDGDYSKYADDDDDDEEDSDDESDNQHDDDDDDDEDSGKGDEDISDDDVGDEEIKSEDEGIQRFSQAATDEVAKGQAAKEQLGLWDTLLEGRIKLQKALSIVNQLPQKDALSDFTETSEAFTEEAAKAQQALGHLLGSLVHLQDLLLHQSPETRHILDENSSGKNKQKQTEAVDEDDEEIPSDSDVEMDIHEDKPDLKTVVRKRKLKADEYPGFLKKRHSSFQEYRNATIQKWYDKTRLAAGKTKGKSFSAFDQSAVVQINQILADKERLVKRTQLKRTVYRVLGTEPKPDQPEIDPSQQGEETVPEKDQLKDHDVEIFDDDDFYHQLLRELIERKTSDVSDPVALSRQWLEIQKLRSRNKKKVDTRASKGRKVRYDVHKKLTNFMAPVDSCDWSHEARDDLFKSLFGKRFSSNHV